MKNQTQLLNIGDEIGFNFLASSADANDETVFFTVVEVTEQAGERAYRYAFPDGTVSRTALPQSALVGHPIRRNSIGDDMICLSDRSDEFRTATERRKNSDLEVFPLVPKSSYAVVNHTNDKEYEVGLREVGGKTYSSCTCPDFFFKIRICKHISAVLTDDVLGLAVKA